MSIILSNIQKMINAGWEVQYDQRDISYNRIPPNGIPQHGIAFKKGILKVWQCIDGYQVAEIHDDCYYRNHRAGSHIIVRDNKCQPLGNRIDRFVNGFIPDIDTVLKLESKNDL